jgi:hypothetical protein
VNLRALAFAGLVAASACSGGGTTLPAPHEQAKAQSGAHGTLTLTLRVPARPTASQGGRAPRYLSAATQSLAVANDAGASFAFDVAPTAPGCSPSGGSFTCTFTLSLALGSQMLTVDAHDQPVSGGAAHGKLLSTITTQILVYEGQSNALNVVLGGVIADLSLTVAPLIYWNRSTANVTVVAKDPDGYVIAGRYAAPIALTYAGNNHAVLDPYAPSTLTLTDSSQTTDVVSAAGDTLSGTVTATVTTGATTVTRSVLLTGSVQSATFALGNTFNQNGSWFGSVSISTPIDRARQPMVVSALAFNVGTNKIEGVAFDPGGNVLVANAGSMSVTVHAPGTQYFGGPVRSFALPGGSAAPTAIAADAAHIYVLTAASIEVLSATDGSLVATVSGDSTALSGASSIAVDATSIYVANQSTSSIAIFPLSANGNVAPALVAGASTGLSGPRGITADGSSIWVANTGAADVRAFAKTASGDVAPSRILGGAGAGMSTPYALGFDVNGNLYVADSGVNRVLMLPAARQGAPGATQQIMVTGNNVANGTGMSVWPN